MDSNVSRPEPPPPFYPTGQQIPFNQPTAGTPLSNIPERAIHAQPFQPFTPQGFQPTAFAGQPAFFYPAANNQQQYAPNAVLAPMFVPNGQQGGGYMVPTIAQAQPQQMQAAAGPSSQGQMASYEQNGTIYYYDPAQAFVPTEQFQPQNFGMPGMGGMMTQEGYYYPQMPGGPVYYPPQ